MSRKVEYLVKNTICRHYIKVDGFTVNRVSVRNTHAQDPVTDILLTDSLSNVSLQHAMADDEAQSDEIIVLASIYPDNILEVLSPDGDSKDVMIVPSKDGVTCVGCKHGKFLAAVDLPESFSVSLTQSPGKSLSE